MRFLLTISLACLFSLTLHSQETEVLVDLTQVDITGYEKQPIYIKFGSGRRKLPEGQRTLTVPVEALPTVIYISTLKKTRFTDRGVFWVDSNELVVSGSIKEKTLVSNIQSHPMQAETSKLLINEYPDPVKEPELAYAKPFLINYYYMRNYLKKSLTEKLVANAPSEVPGFWAYDRLKQYVEDRNAVGFDSKKKVFTELAALNKNQEKVSVLADGERPTLIDFSSSSCRPCIVDIDKMVLLHKEVGDKINMVTLWDDPTYETWTRAASKQKAKIVWPSLWDKSGVVYQKFNIRLLPTYMLFDKNGKLVRTWNSVPRNIQKFL